MPRKPKSLAERLTGVPDRRPRPPGVSVTSSAAMTPLTEPPLPLPPGAQMVTVTLFRGGPEDWANRLPPLEAAVTPARSTWVDFDRVDGLPVSVRVLGPPLVFEITERGPMSAWFRDTSGQPVIAMNLGECLVGDRVSLGTPEGI